MTVLSTEYSTEEFQLIDHTDQNTAPQNTPEQTESDEINSESSESSEQNESPSDENESPSDETLTPSVDFITHFATVKPNSHLFIVTIDDTPTGYCTTFEDAQIQMKTIADRIWLEYMPESDGGILQPQGVDDELHIIGYSKFYLITYNRILVRLRIVRLREIL
jgi:hypothetical protein